MLTRSVCFALSHAPRVLDAENAEERGMEEVGNFTLAREEVGTFPFKI